MPSITLCTEEIINKTTVPTYLDVRFSLEESVALLAVLSRISANNNYVNNIREAIQSKIQRFPLLPSYYDNLFDSNIYVTMPHSSMKLCNEEAARIKKDLTS